MGQVTLRPRWWYFAATFCGWALFMLWTWPSSGLLNAILVLPGPLTILAVVMALLGRWRHFVEDGMLYSTGWTSSLGSYTSAGLDLRKLSEVRVYVPIFGGLIEVYDSSGNSAAVWRLLWSGWRDFARVVARFALEGNATMTEGTQRRLRRFAT